MCRFLKCDETLEKCDESMLFQVMLRYGLSPY